MRKSCSAYRWRDAAAFLARKTVFRRGPGGRRWQDRDDTEAAHGHICLFVFASY
jgi:hypothetical protein